MAANGQGGGAHTAANGADGIADRVRQVIEATGWSRREFARRIVMDPSKLSRSLGGTRRFTLAEIVRIADTGGVDVGVLLGTPVAAAVDQGGTDVPAEGAGGPAPGEAPGTPPRPRTAAPPDSGRPLQIVRETVRLIAEHGFHEVRVSDIAAACGTSTAAIHYHFPGRDELLEASVRWCMDEDAARRAAGIAATGDPREQLLHLIALQTPRTDQQRRQWRVWLDLWAEAARSTAVGRLHADFYREWRATVAEVVRRGVHRGRFRAVDPEATALRLTALIDGLAVQVLATAAGSTSADAMHGALTAFVENELDAADGPAPPGA